MSDEFYILSLKWTRGGDLLTWWCANNSGYTTILEQAGRYPRALVEMKADYYNNGDSTIALPCAVVDAAAHRVVMDHALSRLTGQRFERIMTDSEPCDVCGQESPSPVCVGVRVVGDDPVQKAVPR